jgi:hypothetical protein
MIFLNSKYLSFYLALLGVFNLSFAPTVQADEWFVSGIVDTEVRVFPNAPSYTQQNRISVSPSVSVELEVIYEWNGSDDLFTFKPFVRWDKDDSRRNHVDLREANWLHLGDGWDSVIGVDKVFWGVTESRHLVDVINQTDGVENTNGEAKLGQPIININVEQDWGTLSAFILPGFRERTFADVKGRFSGSLEIDSDNATYDSSTKNKHIDFALRWSQMYGDLDLDVAHFKGTSREPRLLSVTNNGVSMRRPHYDQIDQTSLEAQLTKDATLWKFEAISRSGQGNRFAAVVGGVEHTLYGTFETQADLGLLVEYQYDGRDMANAPSTASDNDVFIGARLTLNDENDSSLLAGALIDAATQTTLISVEAERRLSDHFKMSFEAKVFTNVDAGDPLVELRADDHMIIRVSSYF